MKKYLMAGAAALAAAAGGLASAQVDEAALRAFGEGLNAQLEAENSEYVLSSMHVMFDVELDEEGIEIFFEDRGNKQLSTQFVPGDTRRAWSGGDPNTINWSISTVAFSPDMTPGEQIAATQGAFDTWEAQSCSTLGLNGGAVNAPTGFAAFLIGQGGSPFLFGDIMNNGFYPASFFDAIAPNGSASILGVHFGFSFTGGDSNGDGFADKALGDVYFNDRFTWSTTGAGIDYQTVALHEFGHGLSQQHFGRLFAVNNKDGSVRKFQFSPRAVMNAGYTGPQRDLAGTDNGGHCSLWGSWPNN